MKESIIINTKPKGENGQKSFKGNYLLLKSIKIVR